LIWIVNDVVAFVYAIAPVSSERFAPGLGELLLVPQVYWFVGMDG